MIVKLNMVKNGVVLQDVDVQTENLQHTMLLMNERLRLAGKENCRWVIASPKGFDVAVKQFAKHCEMFGFQALVVVSDIVDRKNNISTFEILDSGKKKPNLFSLIKNVFIAGNSAQPDIDSMVFSKN